MKKTRFINSLGKLIFPAIFLLLFSMPVVYLESTTKQFGDNLLDKIRSMGHYALETFLWLAIAWFIVRCLDVFIWEGLFLRRRKTPVSKLLKDLVAFIIFVIALAGILGVVFELPLTGILATSGAVGIVIGLALKNMISDVFSGIAINIEQPFNIGDAIGLENGIVGIVIDISWRTTSIQPYTDIIHIIPNGLLSSMEIKNYDRPYKYFRLILEFYLDFQVPTDRALRILTAAVKSVAVPVLEESDVLLIGIGEFGVQYRVRYWVPKFVDYNLYRTQVIASVMHHLYQAGITPVYHKHDVYISRMPPAKFIEADKVDLLSRVDLLKTLDMDELQRIADQLEPRNVEIGEAIVHQGDEGESLFIIAEGLLHVFIKIANQETDIHIGKMDAGDFFGEIALLTGDKRSATVIAITECLLYEIKKEHIAPLLEDRPDLAHRLSMALAEREMNSNQALQQLDALQKSREEEKLSRQFFEKMSKIFAFLK